MGGGIGQAVRRSYQATQPLLLFGYLQASITGTGLDSPRHTESISHRLVLATRSAGRQTNNPKTVIVVVANPRIIVVASGGAAIPRIVDPGAAAL
ncbi:MAG: hypothetical protein MUF49_11515 [Oculatellaceae cyanobacterium Prado106]|nr:hypothetical protein [Oculatellaceae cyanobacterium Prado106]